MEYMISVLLSGIAVGGQYALIAIGYTMVYGILRLINFAHGDVFMVAGLMGIYFAATMPLYIALPLVIVMTVVLGFVIERLAYKPLRTAPRMSVMISAIGVSYFLQNTATYITGGQIRKPILLKRGLANTLKELLMSAEYIMAGGNEQVILCERGIRTFDDYTRNTLDLAAVPMLKELTHLPIIVDPSHATGIARLVPPMALAATASGADGLIIEVHNDPMHALCDGAQSLRPEQYDALVKKVNAIREVTAE